MRSVTSATTLIDARRLRSGSGHICSYGERHGRTAPFASGEPGRTTCHALDVEIPRNRLVVFVGVSGSGKSSLVFDTIAAEAGYQLNETFPPFARNRLPKWTRPDVEHIDGLSPVVVIDQRRIGGNARSTVGTITDTWTYLRLLFSRLSEPHVGESNHFSFNDPAGMCPTCSGLGEVVVSAVERFLDLDKSLAGRARSVLPGFGDGRYWYRQYADIGTFDADTPLRDWSPAEREALLYGGEAAAQLGRKPPKDYEGVVERFERIYLHTSDNLSERKQATLRRFTRSQVCPDCGGDRLNEAVPRRHGARAHHRRDVAHGDHRARRLIIGGIDAPDVAPVVAALTERLDGDGHDRARLPHAWPAPPPPCPAASRSASRP